MNDTMLSPQALLDRLQWRYATKKFDPSKKISPEDWQVLEQSLVLSPSSFGLQPWKFFVVRNPELREQLKAHAWGQSQVTDASHLVVIANRSDVTDEDVDRYVKRMAEVQGTSVEDLQGYANVVKGFLKAPPFPLDPNKWAGKQAYIAMAFLLYTAAILGIDACPMEGFIPAKFDEVLGLAAQGYNSVAFCTLGYRASDDKSAARPKVRYETAEVVSYID
ncbi:MAG: NAD(P)H-dependent oxidoreductase [Cyanobacteria bacterium J06632_22]